MDLRKLWLSLGPVFFKKHTGTHLGPSTSSPAPDKLLRRVLGLKDLKVHVHEPT